MIIKFSKTYDEYVNLIKVRRKEIKEKHHGYDWRLGSDVLGDMENKIIELYYGCISLENEVSELREFLNMAIRLLEKDMIGPKIPDTLKEIVAFLADAEDVRYASESF
jgi:hypothetical protein